MLRYRDKRNEKLHVHVAVEGMFLHRFMRMGRVLVLDDRQCGQQSQTTNLPGRYSTD